MGMRTRPVKGQDATVAPGKGPKRGGRKPLRVAEGFGRRVYEATIERRDEAGRVWGTRHLAHELGVHRNTATRWITDSTIPDATTLSRLAQVLNRSESYLLYGEPGEPAAKDAVRESPLYPLYLPGAASAPVQQGSGSPPSLAGLPSPEQLEWMAPAQVAAMAYIELSWYVHRNLPVPATVARMWLEVVQRRYELSLQDAARIATAQEARADRAELLLAAERHAAPQPPQQARTRPA